MQFWLCLIDIHFLILFFYFFQSDYHQHLTRWLIYVSCALNFVALKCWENCRTYINSLLNWTSAFAHFEPTRWNLLCFFFLIFLFPSHFKTKKIESVYLHQQTFRHFVYLFVYTLMKSAQSYKHYIYARCCPGQVGRWNLIVARGMLKPVYFAFVETMLECFFSANYTFCTLAPQVPSQNIWDE